MSNKINFFVAIIICLAALGVEISARGKDTLSGYVNPIIGTAPAQTISALKHGSGVESFSQVVPFVTVPFGMTNWTPQTRDTEKKCVAPYYYNDSLIQGFRGSHWLSGSCVQDYGSVTVMPISGELVCSPLKRGSRYSHNNEITTPYYYKVILEDYNISTEMTAATRAGMFRIKWLKGGVGHVIINPNSDEGVGYVKVIPERNEVAGYNPVHRIYQGYGKPAGFNGYFVARFSRKFSGFGVYEGDKIIKGGLEICEKKEIGSYASFELKSDEELIVTIGTSFTSIEAARANLDAELKNHSFEELKEKLRAIWEEKLSLVKVEGSKEEDKTKFYTAIYHSFLHPRIFNDIDGSYPKFAGGDSVLKIYNGNYYCDFTMWDSYRALHPLFNLLVPEINKDMMRSLLLKGEQGGWLPIFSCWNSYTSAMIGDHCSASISDAVSKNVIEISEKEYRLLYKNATQFAKDYPEYLEGKSRRALKTYLQYGYIPLEDSVKEAFHKGEQVSRTLEYAFDDFTLALTALKMGKTEDYKMFAKRAMNYTNVYNKEAGCVLGRYKDGSWVKEYDKLKRIQFITEGTPWQYTWYVPHDLAGLIMLMGGDDSFSDSLDSFFAAGQYWHGNEPGHQTTFLYNYCGKPWKTQEKVREVINEEYGTGPGGLSGNDDGGQMSAWYLFASLGFYPVCPGVPQYVISGPVFDRIEIKTGNNKTLVITAPGASSGKKYIHGIKFNGKEYDKNYFDHSDLINGGKIEFLMGDKPNFRWGVNKESRPFSLSTGKMN